MHACFAALLVAQDSSLHGWKKAEPGCEGAMHCCGIAAIAACRPCGIYNCVATLRIVKAIQQKFFKTEGIHR